MSDWNDSDGASSTDDQTQRVIFPEPDIDTHEYRKVDQTQLWSTESCTAYELTLECQEQNCSRTVNPVLTEGDLPKTEEEVDDLMYEIYQWFYENSDDIPPFVGNSPRYLAAYALIPGSRKDPALLGPRIGLFLAADTGYEDGHHGSELRQKEDLVEFLKDMTVRILNRMDAEDSSILNLFD